jgi:hypothetical protein
MGGKKERRHVGVVKMLSKVKRVEICLRLIACLPITKCGKVWSGKQPCGETSETRSHEKSFRF